MGCHVFMPADTPGLFAEECRMYGAEVRMVDGYITTAAAAMQDVLKENGWYSVATFREPYRVEGKKTILYELAQNFSWHLPDVILFPTGGGTGIVAAWKACKEMKELGWIARFKMPRLVAVQSSGCAPVVRAWQNGAATAEEWKQADTFASGLRVPRTIADSVILRAIRDSNGAAIAIDDDEIRTEWRRIARDEGIFTCPEGAATVAALKRLREQNWIEPSETVVLLLTGTGLKYAMS